MQKSPKNYIPGLFCFCSIPSGTAEHGTERNSHHRTAKSVEGASAYGMIFMFIPYISSGFVPTETMPVVLRQIAQYQPMTPIIDTLRSFFLAGTAGDSIWIALGWIGGLVALGVCLSIFKFKRKTSK